MCKEEFKDINIYGNICANYNYTIHQNGISPNKVRIVSCFLNTFL